MMASRRAARCLLALAMPLLASGCAGIEPVQPWQKGMLAKPEMTIEGSDILAARAFDHVYVSREAASGGAAIGGGGCGCN